MHICSLDCLCFLGSYGQWSWKLIGIIFYLAEVILVDLWISLISVVSIIILFVFYHDVHGNEVNCKLFVSNN
jgi:hypothetical protein